MERTGDGFELANEDLAIRGPGEFWGIRQHGLTQLKVADLQRDQAILSWATEAAEQSDQAALHNGSSREYIWGRYDRESQLS
jgi:ATP-dependent DNA helicase RecG